MGSEKKASRKAIQWETKLYKIRKISKSLSPLFGSHLSFSKANSDWLCAGNLCCSCAAVDEHWSRRITKSKWRTIPGTTTWCGRNPNRKDRREGSENFAYPGRYGWETKYPGNL